MQEKTPTIGRLNGEAGPSDRLFASVHWSTYISGVCLARGSSAYRSTAAEALMPHYTGLLASGYQNTFDMAQEADVVEQPYCGHLLQG